MRCAGLVIVVMGFIYRLVWVFIWSDCLDCVPVFLLISFLFLFVLWLVYWSVCCRVMGVVGNGERQKKEIIVIIIFLCLTVRGDCVRGGMGEGGFLCAGHVRCVSAGLCVGRCVLSSCLWGVLWPSRAFSCLGRVFVCLFRESVSEWIFGGPCHFLPFLLVLPIFLTFCRFV